MDNLGPSDYHVPKRSVLPLRGPRSAKCNGQSGREIIRGRKGKLEVSSGGLRYLWPLGSSGSIGG